MTILVTGASGFVGSATVAAANRAGIRTRAVVRNGGAPSASETVRIAALGPTTDLGPCMTGVDAVVHLAARVHVTRDRAADPLAEFRAVNVEGTRRLALAAVEAGVRRFVFVSTAKVHGEATRGDPFTAESPLRPSDAYGRSKAEAEEALREIEAREGIEVTVVRPPLVYGPEVRANFLNLLKVVDRGLPLPFGSLRNRRSLIYVGNLADLLLFVARARDASGETFLVSDGAPVSTPELVRRIASALGRRARLVPVPPVILRTAGRLTGRSAAVNRLLGSLEVDGGHAERALGWHPPVRMEQGLLHTAEWFRQEARR